VYFTCKIPVWMLCFVTLLLLGLRAADVHMFPWEWVFAPIWIPVGIIIFARIWDALSG